MISNNLVPLIQKSHGNSKILKKALNSAAYKELSLNEKATTLLAIIENAAGDNEVLLSVIEEFILKLRAQEFFKNALFFSALLSLIKHAHGNEQILNKLLLDEYNNGICSYINKSNCNERQVEDFFIDIAKNADGNIAVLQRILAKINDVSFQQDCSNILILVINCAKGNVKISENILKNYKYLCLKYISIQQQKNIFITIVSMVNHVSLEMLKNIMELAHSFEVLDLKEILTILAKRTKGDINVITKVFDYAHEYLPSQQQKDFFIDLVEITNKDQVVIAMIIEHAQYLLSPYGDEVLKFLEGTKDPATNLLSFTEYSSTLTENKRTASSVQEEEIDPEINSKKLKLAP